MVWRSLDRRIEAISEVLRGQGLRSGDHVCRRWVRLLLGFSLVVLMSCAEKDGQRVLDPVPTERLAGGTEGAALADSAAGPEAGHSLTQGPCIDDRDSARPPQQPDLVVDSLDLAPLSPTSEDEVQIRVLIRNRGYVEADPSNVGIRHNDLEACRLPLSALAPDEVRWTAWCHLGVLGAGMHELEACADIDDVLVEIIEENNCGTREFFIPCGVGDPVVWYVVAAWREEKYWSGYEFGFGAFNAEVFEFVEWGICAPPGGSPMCIYYDQTSWPSANNGIGVVLSTGAAWHGELSPIYWFGGYAYAEGLIPLDVMPSTGVVTMISPLGDPAVADPDEDLGAFGVLRAGLPVYPGSDSAGGPYNLHGFVLITHHPPGLLYTTSENDYCERFFDFPLESPAEQNCAIGAPAQLPDLMIADIEFSPPSPAYDDVVLVRIDLLNQGDAAAARSVMKIRLDGEQMYVFQVSSLAPGEHEWSDWYSLGVPGGGSYEVTACADIQNTVGESDEWNNCSREELTVSSPPVYPDLTVSEMIFWPPEPDTYDEAMQVRIVVCNRGGGGAGESSVSIRLNGIEACICGLPAIPPGGEAQTAFCALGTPGGGIHQVNACADIFDSVDESDEDNNCATEALILPMPPDLPDLVLAEVELSPPTPAYDDVVQVRISIGNQGDLDAAASDAQLSIDGLTVCQWEVPGLPVGETHWTAWFDLGVLGWGTFSFEACADINDAVEEPDEENNCESFELVVLPPDVPDLIVEMMEFSPPIPSGTDVVEVRVRIANTGFVGAAESSVQILANGLEQCRLEVPAVPVGGQLWSDWCVLGALGEGLHEIEACADIDETIDELDEENNCNRDDLYIHGGETASTVWYVIAAWQEEKYWKGFEFGLGDFDSVIYGFIDWGLCEIDEGLAQVIYYDESQWPSARNGLAVVRTWGTWYGNLHPLYWFAGYAYGGGEIPLDVMPATGVASVLPVEGGVVSTTSPDRLGAMGILTAGREVFPGSEGNGDANDLRGFVLIVHHPPGLIYTSSEDDWCGRYLSNPLLDAADQNCTISIPGRARAGRSLPHTGR
ncbi:MAG: hypothetical protein KAY32_15150 [Candidatus Eisenbacteria sp.]|nr:hypothetical protein [Candidatus Eisenbacteria bacterium]